MVYLVDDQTTFLLRAPHTVRNSKIASDIGGRKVAGGYRFPRMMSVYDALHARIPGLNEIVFPSPRGFALKQVGQDNHPKWPLLRDYQRDTIDILISSPHPGVLVELSPGLGKSPVTVVAADAAGFKQVLFVAVKSLRRNWEREIKTWSGRDAVTRFHEPPVDGWTITNYETLVGFYKKASKGNVKNPYARKWDCMILDESVLLKNRKALRTKAIQALRPYAKRVWCLTGSPTTKYADDMWSQLHIIHPVAFSSYWRFTNRYCYVDQSVWGARVVGTRENVDFAWDLRDVMVSYSQRDVLDLPPVLHESIDLDLTPEQQRIYDELLSAFVAELESGVQLSTPNKVSRLTRLQQVVSNLINVEGGDYSSKADAVVELVESGEIEFPCLIWCHWNEGAHALFHRLVEAKVNVSIATGTEKGNETVIDMYKNGDTDVLILSLMIGRFGHHMINTKTVIYVDRSFDGDAYYQSLHRIERFGLSHSPVVYTLRVPNTVEEVVEENLAGKLETVARITNADLVKLLKPLGR